MPKRLPDYCQEYYDRHGNLVIYYRRGRRPKVRLRGVPWTPEFMAQYEAAKNATCPTIKSKGITSGTWGWLCFQYFESVDFKQWNPKTQRERRWILESTFDEKISANSDKLFKDFPLVKMGADAIEVLRDRKFKTPQAANARVIAIKVVFKWAMKKRLVEKNPASGVERVRDNSHGFKAWTIDDVRQFESHHPIGSKARLALALLLYTGQRRGDVVRFGRQHVKNGKLIFKQDKKTGRQKTGKDMRIPIHPELQKIIDASPTGDLAFLVNELNRPWDAHGFGNKFREWCNEAGLPKLSAHGLRKALATFIADAGGSSHMLMAQFGWSTLAMAEHYTKSANQERLAEQAMSLVELPEQTRTESCPTTPDGGTKAQKN
jgi:integrase